MKVYCCRWVGGILPSPPSWWSDDPNKEVEVSPEEIIDLFNTGINVMLYHIKDAVVLAVDNKRFTQR